MGETFDAVLADVMGAPVIEDRHFDRLAAAHAAEVAERDRMVGEQLAIAERAKAEALRQQQERLAATVRTYRAVALLQDIQLDLYQWEFLRAETRTKLNAFLSEQAGERENGTEV